MKVLHLTNMYPTLVDQSKGVFVKRQVDHLSALGVDCDVLHIEGGRTKWNYARGFSRLREKLRRQNYDIVHAHYGYCGFLCAFEKNLTLITSFYGSDVMHPAQRILSKYADLKSKVSIFKSKALCDMLGSRRGVIIPDGVDFELFKPANRSEARQLLGIPEDEFIVLFIGDPQRTVKRYTLATEATGILRKTNDKVRLLPVYGKPQHIIPVYLNAANVLLLTSKWEGSPNAVKEALACNIPFVAVDVGDIREYIHKIEGCSIARPTPSDIADKLSLVLSDPHDKAENREAIRDVCWQEIVQKIVQLYKQVLSSR